MANSNRRKNSIYSLLIDGTISTKWFDIIEHIVQFYQKVYTEQFRWWLLVDDLFFDSIEEAGG